MNDRVELPRVRRSIFAKVVTSMLIMGASIVLLVGGFLFYVINPNLNVYQGRLAFHNGLVLMLLLLIAGVVFTAHVVLNRALAPLRSLEEGVARLTEGHFDIELPRGAPDEFGALTDAFNVMVRRVNEMIRARDQLLLDVSHELRSPLTRMKVALELLPAGQTNGLAGDVAEMEAMVTELLELERLREGRGLTLERHDLASLIRDLVDHFQGRPPGVVLNADRSEIVLHIDPEKIRTVMRNLLENAIKYSLPDSKAVEISVTRHGETAVIRVCDDGPGIPSALRTSVFEPFFRADRSRSRKTGGYGLGLSICKRIMEAHGGGIAIEDHAGRGASFVLTLPAA
jgi:signal transduction histidine kinase